MFVKSPTVEAKVGLWGDVFEKLDEKPDLINSTAGTTPLKPDDDDVPEAGACDGVGIGVGLVVIIVVIVIMHAITSASLRHVIVIRFEWRGPGR